MRLRRVSLPLLFGLAVAFATGSLGLGATARVDVGPHKLRVSTTPVVTAVTGSFDVPLVYRIAGVTNIPVTWIFTGGWRLASVRIGDTQGRVKSAWGKPYDVCSNCKTVVWFYVSGHVEPRGIAVKFNHRGRVAELFGLPSYTGPRSRP